MLQSQPKLPVNGLQGLKSEESWSGTSRSGFAALLCCCSALWWQAGVQGGPAVLCYSLTVQVFIPECVVCENCRPFPWYSGENQGKGVIKLLKWLMQPIAVVLAGGQLLREAAVGILEV